jgi:hypothetical protein
VQYVLDELQEYDLARDEAARIQVRGLKAWPPRLAASTDLPMIPPKPSVVRGSWEAESPLPDELHNKLVNEVNKLSQVPDKDKDWHPGSDGQVLDLVHPSM